MFALRFAVAASVLVLCSISPGVNAQTYPAKTIRLLTGSAGGSADFTARLVAQSISGPLGQAVVVINESTDIAAALLKNPPDGYTLLIGGSLTWIAPLLRDNAPWDAATDLAPITLATRQPLILVVHPSLPVRTIKDLIVLAKSRPGDMNYSQGSIGGTSHLATELFKSMSGINMVAIPYNGTGAVVNALISGEVQMTIIDPSAGLPHIKSGRMKALAVTSAQPSPLLPGLPTVAATGLPNYESTNTGAFFAPAKTPEAVIRRLNREIVTVLSQQGIKDKFFNVGVEAVGTTPEELGTLVKTEIVTMGKVISDARLKIQGK